MERNASTLPALSSRAANSYLSFRNEKMIPGLVRTFRCSCGLPLSWFVQMQAECKPRIRGPRELQKRKAGQAGGWDGKLSKQGRYDHVDSGNSISCLSLLMFKGIFRSRQATHTNPQPYNAFKIFC
jgi:hypothetical protein